MSRIFAKNHEWNWLSMDVFSEEQVFSTVFFFQFILGNTLRAFDFSECSSRIWKISAPCSRFGLSIQLFYASMSLWISENGDHLAIAFFLAHHMSLLAEDAVRETEGETWKNWNIRRPSCKKLERNSCVFAVRKKLPYIPTSTAKEHHALMSN